MLTRTLLIFIASGLLFGLDFESEPSFSLDDFNAHRSDQYTLEPFEHQAFEQPDLGMDLGRSNTAQVNVNVSVTSYAVHQSDPPYLTPYIEKGQLDDARRSSFVTDLPGYNRSFESYSGYLTINKTYNSNTFFWFFPSKDPKAPVILWLLGGPGWSSLYALFNMNGPFKLDSNLQLSSRKESWTNVASVIYFDNPIGTGFSFTKDDRGHARTEVQIALDLYEALRQFFIIFHQFKSNPFYLAGESYGGKYICRLGELVLKWNPAGLELKGIAIGNGFLDPISYFDQGDYLYQLGLISAGQNVEYQKIKRQAVTFIKKRWFKNAASAYVAMNGTYTKFTGLDYNSNILFTVDPIDNYLNQYLNQANVQKALHVGSIHYSYENMKILSHLIDQAMRSVKPQLEAIMRSGLKVLLYNGQLDAIVYPSAVENMLYSMKWKYLKQYHESPPQIWKVDPKDKEVAGYVRKVTNFVHVVVRNAGHMAPHDQPRACLDMITKFINDKF